LEREEKAKRGAGEENHQHVLRRLEIALFITIRCGGDEMAFYY